MKNDAEIEFWNGPAGERWALWQEGLDARIRAYGKDVLTAAELRPGMRVLDVGCGCGELTLEAAATVGANGVVVGVDVSRPMLARGRERAAALANVALIEHDAATFTPEAPFDVVLSRFGVMFFDDPASAFANLRRATAPGGKLAFACWQALEHNPWAAVPLSAVLRVAAPAPEPSPHAPGPFAFADPDRVRQILAEAGWSEVAITPAVHPMKLGSTLDDVVEYTSRMGPAARALREADAATQPRGLEMLRQTLAPFAPDFLLDGAVWIVTARA